jgi:dephospho-CoA kinase
MIVGLTGGIGSGKTTVVKLFQEFNTVAVYIADVEAKRIMNSCKVVQRKLIEAFGAETYSGNLLDKEYLAGIVFNSKEQLSLLNSIVHPAVHQDFENFVLANVDKVYIIYESAILLESKNAQNFDFLITVFVAFEERIKRVIKRDKTLKKAVLARINAQGSEDKKILLSNYIIYNTTLESTKSRVRHIHNILTKKQETIS